MKCEIIIENNFLNKEIVHINEGIFLLQNHMVRGSTKAADINIKQFKGNFLNNFCYL